MIIGVRMTLIENYELKLEIKKLPKTPNAIGKASIWQSHAERHLWKRAIAAAIPIKERPPMPLEKAELVLTRHSSVEPDLDNLYSSFKFVIDALVHTGIIEDDKPSKIDLKCKWQKAKRNEGKITIEARPLVSRIPPQKPIWA